MSRRVLSDIQERVISNHAGTVVLVEGLSDCFAIEAAASRCGCDLRGDGVDVMPMGGATNLTRFLQMFGPTGRGVRLAGLCDLGEEGLFARALERARLADRVDQAVMRSLGFFVCDRDLEDELIRAVGQERVEEIIERQGELASLRMLQQMPFHRGRPPSAHLHRFMGARSGRKYRYAPLLVRALDADAMPRPLSELLAHVCGSRAGS
jgi:hypothetical protein